jgi:hypothetical protein
VTRAHTESTHGGTGSTHGGTESTHGGTESTHDTRLRENLAHTVTITWSTHTHHRMEHTYSPSHGTHFFTDTHTEHTHNRITPAPLPWRPCMQPWRVLRQPQPNPESHPPWLDTRQQERGYNTAQQSTSPSDTAIQRHSTQHITLPHSHKARSDTATQRHSDTATQRHSHQHITQRTIRGRGRVFTRDHQYT